jgi:peptide/nickel transport system substrate-binding protein
MRGGAIALAGGGSVVLAAGETVIKEVEVIREVQVETVVEVIKEIEAAGAEAIPGIVVANRDATLQIGGPYNPVTGGKISWGSFGNPAGFDPQSLVGGTFEQFAMFEALYTWAPGNRIVPLLASGMPEASDDRLAWTIPLRKDVQFHDGEPWNADAAIFNFERFMDESAVRGRVANNVASLSLVEKVDEFTIRLHTKEPNALLIKQLYEPYLMFASPKAITEMGEDFQRNPVGTGPWVFKDWVDNVAVTVVRNEDYTWGSEGLLNQGPPHADELSFLQLSNDTISRGLAFEAGEVDGLIHFNFQQIQRMAFDDRFTSIGLINLGMGQYMPMNTQLAPLDDLKVRQAFIYGVNRALVTARIAGGVPPFTFSHYLDPGTKGRNEDVGDMYWEDTGVANRLLDEAGWAMGDDGFRAKDGKRMEVIWPNTSGPGGLQPVFKLDIEANLGIFVDSPSMEFATYAEGMANGQFHFGYVGIGGSDGDVLWDRFHTSAYGISGRAWSFFQYDGVPGTATPGSSVDALLDGARSEFDEAKRIALWQDLEKLLLENAVAIPMVQEMLPYLVNHTQIGGNLFFGGNFNPRTQDLYSLKG